MQVIFDIIFLLGSLGLFLYGMTLMSESLQKVAGEKLRNVLAAMTSTPLKRILTGLFITAVIQSSSATTVMVVSFVNAGLLSLVQSIGVIMGANIGTTMTAWLISLLGFKADISTFAIPIIAFGFVFYMCKSKKKKSIGELLIGFSLLFVGLSSLKDSVPELTPEILSFLQGWINYGFGSILIFVLIGTILTVIIQSSSATMALTLIMCNNGWIPFEMGAAMVLGENIGTTITANIAATVANVSGKRAARAHTIFNLFGVTWALIFFHPFLFLVSKIIIALGCNNPLELGASSTSILYGISMVHTLFNTFNTAILIWFTPQIVKVVELMVKKSKETDEVFRLKYIQGGLLDTAELSLTQAKEEIIHYADLCKKEFAYVKEITNSNPDKFDTLYKKIEHYEQVTDKIEFEIASYLNNVAQGDISNESSKKLQAMYRIIGELESIGDSGYNIARILQRKNLHNKDFNSNMIQKINLMISLIDNAINIMISNLKEDECKDINNAYDIEKSINECRDSLKEEHLLNLENNTYNYLTGVYYMDLINECEHVGDYIINVSESLVE